MTEAARTALDATPEVLQPGSPQADAGFYERMEHSKGAGVHEW
jgi:hypothetical protein